MPASGHTLCPSVNELLNRRRGHRINRHRERSGELPQADAKVSQMNFGASRSLAVRNEFGDNLAHRLAGHVGWMALGKILDRLRKRGSSREPPHRRAEFADGSGDGEFERGESITR